jgi:hypothetical protein
MKKPNFFLIGAPKCGTTAINQYLRDHPKIFIPKWKEIHYFSPDFPNYQKVTKIEEYLSLFNDANEEHFAVGEASVFYMYSKYALDRILEFDPNAKILIMLRNPISMIYSNFFQCRYGYEEDENEFLSAWKLQEDRARGENIPRHCSMPQVLQYKWLASLGTHVERIKKNVSPENLHITVFDDFINDTKAEYEKVLHFLNVPSNGRVIFPRVNEFKDTRVRGAIRYLRKPPAWLMAIVNAFKNILGIERIGFKQLMTKHPEKPKMDNKTFTLILRELEPEIRKLEDLLGRDFEKWRSVESV